MAVKNRPAPKKDGRSPFKDREKLLTDPVFLLGNGKSRLEFDLERLRSVGTIVGCNALYRDFKPDVLVAIDAKMLKELHVAKYGEAEDEFVIIPSNRSVNVPKARKWKTERFNTSGCFAMKLISALMQPKHCYMLGMDCYPGNVYDKTQNYAPNTLQNFTGVGGFYLKALQASKDTVFVNVNVKDTWPKEAQKHDKYAYMTYEQFEKDIMA